ncbi:MAG TPA: glycine cleavage system protein GcvH [Planctomycetes bacterium]|nr:glycine cleavage system protein GcvH [Planctomycetota bacterium]
MAPADRKYLKSHEWAKKNDDGTISVGITDVAVEHLSDLVFLDLPEVGKQVEKEQPFGEIESVKAVSELLAPVSGEVVQVHEDLADNLDLLSNSPYEDGWMIRIKPSDETEWEGLLSAEDYDKIAHEE